MIKITLPGLIATVAIFFFLFALMFQLIKIENPLTGQEQTVLEWVWDTMSEGVFDSIWPW